MTPGLPAGRRGWWPRRLTRGRTAAAALVLLALFTLDAGWRVYDIQRELRLAAAEIRSTQAALGPLLRFDASGWPNRAQFSAITGSLDSAQRHLDRARSRLGHLRYVAFPFRALPVLGPQIGGGIDALDLAADVVRDGRGVLQQADPLFVGDGRIAERAREVLVTRHPQLDRHFAGLVRSAAEAERLRGIRWTGPLRRAEPLIADLAGDLAQVGGARVLAAAAAQGLDPLLGFDGPRTYIVLGQNEQEIRPTGGFAGTMGVIVVERGRLVSSDYRSTYDFDPPRAPRRKPPEPMAKYMGAGAWYTRDANWDADFPTSAERVLQFMEQDQAIKAHGVVAVNTPMIRLLLRATGAVTIPELPEPLTADNFMALLEEEIFEPGTDSFFRKRQILQPVLQQLVGRVQDASAEQVPGILAAMHAGARGRDLQVFARDPRSTALVQAMSVDGRLQVREGRDFLAVVDGNVSYNKIQLAISRDITYLLRADGRVDLLVRWRNEGSALRGQYPRLAVGGQTWNPALGYLEPITGTFGNFVRIYLPPDTTFEHSRGFADPPGLRFDGGMTVIEGMVWVPDGKTASVVLTYRPRGPGGSRPTGVDIWKQGGQERDTLRVLVGLGDTQEQLFDGRLVGDLDLAIPPLPARSTRSPR